MRLVLAAVFAAAFLTQPALAQDRKGPSPAQKAQQERMKDCNAKAKGMKGDERKDFMKGCLSGKADDKSGKMSAQQEKMKDCNAKAKGMKGAERQKFMSGCLKGS